MDTRLTGVPAEGIAAVRASAENAARSLPRHDDTVASEDPSLGLSPKADEANPSIPGESETTGRGNGIQSYDLPEYLPTSELEIRPHPIRPIEPTTPEDAEPQSMKVVLRLWISPEGKVDRVVTVSGPEDERFSRSAATAFAMSRFSPGVKHGVPVGTEMLVEVVFERETIAESKSSAQR